MRILVIMDPIEKTDVDRDTTFGFLLAAQSRGHEAFYCDLEHIYLRPGGEPGALAVPVEVRHQQADFYSLGERVDLPLSSFATVWMRKDPPVDRAYSHVTRMLDRAGEQTFVVNRSSALRAANEKLYTLNFSDLTPTTLVTRNVDQVLDWLKETGGPLIVKPVDGHGGSGVMMLSLDDRNARCIVETLTEEGRLWVLAQPYLPAAREGDKRIILLDGRPMGGILRVPRDDDNRGNIHVGASVLRAELTRRDLEICRAMRGRLRADGLYFVGLDVIGEHLIEVNVTSPTGIRELHALGGPDVGDAFVRWVEARIKS